MYYRKTSVKKPPLTFEEKRLLYQQKALTVSLQQEIMRLKLREAELRTDALDARITAEFGTRGPIVWYFKRVMRKQKADLALERAKMERLTESLQKLERDLEDCDTTVRPPRVRVVRVPGEFVIVFLLVWLVTGLILLWRLRQ